MNGICGSSSASTPITTHPPATPGAQPTTARWAHPPKLRLFAFCVPFVLTAIYIGFLGLTTGVWWETSVWAGAPVIAGITGWVLAFVALPGEAAAERIASATPLTISTPADDRPTPAT